MSHKVTLAVYDITKGMARGLSMSLVGKQLDGVWHTGVIAYGHEYFWGSGGIATCLPGELFIGPPDQLIEIGTTEIPFEVFLEYLQELSKDVFRGDKYHLIEKNCNNFSNEVCQFLTGNPIPPHIVGLPAEIMSTPFGQMIRPMIDHMMSQVNGMEHVGTVPLPAGPSAAASLKTGSQPKSDTPNSPPQPRSKSKSPKDAKQRRRAGEDESNEASSKHNDLDLD